MNLPQAPMPPPPNFNHGPFEGVPIASLVDDRNDYEDDYGRRDDDLLDEWTQAAVKPKKNKKAKDDITPVEIKYEGYMLQKATPRVGENLSWARVGSRTLPYEQKKLEEIAKQHRQRTGSSTQSSFSQLTSNQQGVINRLIFDRKLLERNKNADWILYDVQQDVKWSWTSKEVRKIQVILKRIDRSKAKIGDYTTRGSKASYQEYEIIDLLDDPSKPKAKPAGIAKTGKKPKKSRSLDDLNILDDPLGLGFGSPPPPPNHMQNNRHNHQMPQSDFMPPPPPGPPLGAIPIHQMPPNQFPPPLQQQQQQQQQLPYPTSARQSMQNINPFTPDPNVAAPIQFADSPPMMGHEWPHLHHTGKIRARSQSRERRPSIRRQSMDARRVKQLEDKVDEMNFKLQNWQIGDESSDSVRDEDSIFSPPPSDGRSFSPPSSPRSYFSEGRPRGSLERRKSTSSRNPRYHQRYRSNRYRDVEVEPEYTYRSDRPEYARDPGRRSQRPSLHHAATYDDYPAGRGAEQRYLPAPVPPRVIQRRLTEYGEGYDYRDREFDDVRRDYRRRPSRDYDPVKEAYEQGRRDSLVSTGRRPSYGGTRDYYS